jgi:hypothetical protein
MADSAISGLPELTTPTDDIEFIINDNGINKRIKNTNMSAASGAETPSGLLTKLKTVDGVGSGLDADTIQNQTPNNLSLNGGYF